MASDREQPTPLMKCGHAANSVSDGKPACVICAGLDPGAYVVDETPPDISQRRARCHHYGHRAPSKCESNYGTKPGKSCMAEQPSATSLPFFSHQPGGTFDRFYCGCWGWD